MSIGIIQWLNCWCALLNMIDYYYHYHNYYNYWIIIIYYYNKFLRPCVLSDCPPVFWWLSPGEWWDSVTWCGWDKLQKRCNYWCQVYQMSSIWANGCKLMIVCVFRCVCVCVCVIWLDMTTHPWWREKVMVLNYYNYLKRPGESDWHPISLNTPAPQYQPIERKRNGKQ